MAKFHVNQNTGENGVCTATVQACPIGGESDHYNNKADAVKGSEQVLSRLHGTIPVQRKRTSINFDEVAVNEEDFPHPQANRLDKVSTTVDAIHNGATTANSISHALDVVDRQGYYYGDAAGYLGFVDAKQDGDFKEYSLTSRGELFVEQDAAGREAMIRDTIDKMPLMQIYREEGEDEAIKFIQDSQDVNDVTAKRRLATVKTWDSSLQTPLSESIENDKASSTGRFINASQYATEQKEKRTLIQAKEARGQLCNSCFMEMPLTGDCQNCD